MSKRNDAIFEDVLKDMNREATLAKEDRGATRFLRRSIALADVGEREETVLRRVPARRAAYARTATGATPMTQAAIKA